MVHLVQIFFVECILIAGVLQRDLPKYPRITHHFLRAQMAGHSGTHTHLLRFVLNFRQTFSFISTFLVDGLCLTCVFVDSTIHLQMRRASLIFTSITTVILRRLTYSNGWSRVYPNTRRFPFLIFISHLAFSVLTHFSLTVSLRFA